MPQRLPTARPTVVAGTVIESGTPNTGQILQTIGGTHNTSFYSGSLTDQNIWVGAGRLDFALYANISANRAASGIPIIFYDSAIALALPPLSGGTLGTSGAKLLGVLSPAVTASGTTVYGERRDFSTVFTSGLCVNALSGASAFAVGFTPVVSG